ncbi:prolipoprotein diacylglyceryl transferase [Myxococcus sp. MISCRS1]|uniref:prolipoprotein diacylglyceryl transferase n=1 Tax=Myxococcus sp. MISCRS1 TaxID=2996786 RepID=UPI00226EFB91|nr:prolipoprotein diacylglyceryl transferase family protein [Myxococcus sp. MISCRS1]MCY0999426.1 prolipoprotein diacylglyceryl transferase [Myxococcus sp. MISCRS1]BDT30570.1 prolipoprotein diacylglyceryl transferase [Myxococcus sp. MH1]
MIPYWHAPSLKLGPLTIEPFGIFVAAGILLAANLLGRQAKRQGLDPTPLADYAPWGVGVGVLVGHWVHLFFYHPEELSKSPFQILKVWDGLSSFGGLVGGIIAAIFFFRHRKLRFNDYADAFALGVAPGWAVARLGCFAVHDHPGVRTDFFLAVAFPNGPRHDLGMYDAIALFAISGLLYALRDVEKMKGRLLPLLAILYAACRFGFDFLRATDMSYVDARYFGMTPAQYGCFALVAYGLWGLLRRREPSAQAAAPGEGSHTSHPTHRRAG